MADTLKAPMAVEAEPATRRVRMKPSIMLLLIAAPGILHFIIFRYIPLLGNIIVFQNYNVFRGFLGSPWAGLEHFRRMFTYPEFYQILRNTLLISLYSVVFGFPAPLILSLLFNELRGKAFPRVIQTILYLPHFISWVIIGGIFLELLSRTGVVNQFLALFGWTPVNFVTEPDYFRGVLVGVGIWRSVGWGMIIYLAAISGVDPNLYEAAFVDGAGRWRQMWHVTLPSILPAIVTLLLLRIGQLLESNVEQVLVFLNPLVRDVGEVINTYVYRVGLLGAQFSYTTAIGIFKSLVGLTMVVSLNALSKRLTGESIY